MKKKAIQICSLIGLLIGLMVSAQAQSGAQYRFKIPFDFNVENKTFRAGEYVVSFENPFVRQNVLTIRNTKSCKAQIEIIIPEQIDESAEFSKLIFKHYGNQYFLSEVKTPTFNGKFRRAKAEDDLAKIQKTEQETVAMVK